MTELAKGDFAHANPQILPGGKAVLFVVGTLGNADKNSIEVVSLADHRRKTVVRGGSSARYLPSGHLVYVNRGTLFAIPFDLDRLETHGTAVPVLDQVAHGTQSDAAQFDVSRTGTMVYRRATGSGMRMMTVQWLDGTGKAEPLLAKPGVYMEPHLSPDGRRLALVVAERGNQAVWVYDWQRGTMTRLTSDGGPYGDPVWSPDGRYVVFDSYTGGIFWTRADGAGQPQPLTQRKGFQPPVSFTPDGKRLAYHEGDKSFMQIWTVPVEDNAGQLRAGKPEQFLKSQFSQNFSAFSPDGRWLAYSGNESGDEEVYVRAFPASRQDGRCQISTSGGTAPVWSRSGHELLYFAGDRIMAASYAVKGGVFFADKPRVWVAKAGTLQVQCDFCFDVSPDGKRVAVLTPVAPKQEHEVVFLFNFFDELRRRVPVGK